MGEFEYDIQELFIDGLEVEDIANELQISIGKVVEVLNSFGVAA